MEIDQKVINLDSPAKSNVIDRQKQLDDSSSSLMDTLQDVKPNLSAPLINKYVKPIQ